MRIAIPTAAGRLARHFGHSDAFTILDVDPERKAILKSESVPAPEHQPGLLPQWLAERQVERVIAGGMGRRAQALFQQAGIEVVVGAPAEEPRALAEAYLRGDLVTGDNLCDH